MSRREIKIEKEKKFKREYIPVILAFIILLVLMVAIVFVIAYEPKEQKIEETKANTVTFEDIESNGYLDKCEKEEVEQIKKVSNGISVEYYPIKVPYELESDPEDVISWEDEDEELFETKVEIKISGLTDDVYLKIKNSINSDVIRVEPKDYKNGEYIFYSPDIARKILYIIDIVSNKGGCINEVARKVSFKTKVYNIFADSPACIMYPNYPKCNKMMEKEITYDEFQIGLYKYMDKHPDLEEKAQENIIKAIGAAEEKEKEKNNTITEQEKEQKKKNKLVEKIKKEKTIIITVLSVIGVGVIAVIALAMIRRRK